MRTAVSFVFAPDVALDEMDMAEEVLVAVMVLRDHRSYDPLEPGHQFSLDLDLIEVESPPAGPGRGRAQRGKPRSYLTERAVWLGGWVAGFRSKPSGWCCPIQSIHVVSGLHNLQEHERVAIAVERASRTGPSPAPRAARRPPLCSRCFCHFG